MHNASSGESKRYRSYRCLWLRPDRDRRTRRRTLRRTETAHRDRPRADQTTQDTDFDEATSSLDAATAEQCELHTISSLGSEIVVDSPTLGCFAATTDNFSCASAHRKLRNFVINQLKVKVTMMFITHAMPKNLLVDEVVRIGQGVLSAVGEAHSVRPQGQADKQEAGA